MSQTINKPIIIAHRGNNYTFPENSLIGLRSAFELGCHAVEFDIQMTTDGVFAIIHDTTTQRTSNTNIDILSHDYQALSHISAHEPERFSSNYNPTPISTLDDFLPLLTEFPNTHAYIEVKVHSIKKFGHQAILDTLITLVTPYQTKCTIITFDLQLLELIRAHSKISIGWVLERYDQNALDHAQRVKPDFLIIDQAELSLSEPPWQGQWEWMVYGVNNADLAFQHYQNGVQHVETDHLPTLFEDSRLTP